MTYDDLLCVGKGAIRTSTESRIRVERMQVSVGNL
jgi:hypothetical protein